LVAKFLYSSFFALLSSYSSDAPNHITRSIFTFTFLNLLQFLSFHSRVFKPLISSPDLIYSFLFRYDLAILFPFLSFQSTFKKGNTIWSMKCILQIFRWCLRSQRLSVFGIGQTLLAILIVCCKKSLKTTLCKCKVLRNVFG
jgi:hypothetical protein